MPKQIAGAVGLGGANRATDVAVVQYLLDCVPVLRGGPAPELAIDGLCGPKTAAAIRNFQRANGCPQDGRVDPGGPTFRALSAYDPYPNRNLPPLGAGNSKGGGKGMHGPAGGGKSGFGPGGKTGFGGGDGAYGKNGFGKSSGFGPGGGDPFGKTGFGGGGKSGFGTSSGFGTGGGDPLGKGGFGGGGFGKGGGGKSGW